MDDLQQVLLAKRSVLRAALNKDVEFLRNAPDTEDESALCAAQMETNELSRIDAALSKMQDGSYGLCEDCGKRIPKARLEALPHATRCLSCQLVSEGEQPLDDGPNWERLAKVEDEE